MGKELDTVYGEREASDEWLLLGSGVVTGLSCNQAGDERAEQGFAASARVVHELEEAGVSRTHPHERIGMGVELYERWR